MGENIVGRFRSLDEARAAFDAIRQAGWHEDALQLIEPNPQAERIAEMHPQQLGGPLDREEEGPEVVDETHANLPPHASTDAFLIVRGVEDAGASRVVRWLEQHGVTELEHRNQKYEPGQWQHDDDVGEPQAARITTDHRAHMD